MLDSFLFLMGGLLIASAIAEIIALIRYARGDR
jgi:hypothetical protein